MVIGSEEIVVDVDDRLAVLEDAGAVAVRHGGDAGDFLDRVVKRRPDDVGVDVYIHGCLPHRSLMASLPAQCCHDNIAMLGKAAGGRVPCSCAIAGTSPPGAKRSRAPRWRGYSLACRSCSTAPRRANPSRSKTAAATATCRSPWASSRAT